jgi:hypothetical protein
MLSSGLYKMAQRCSSQHQRDLHEHGNTHRASLSQHLMMRVICRLLSSMIVMFDHGLLSILADASEDPIIDGRETETVR